MFLSPPLPSRSSWMPKYVPDASCILYLPGQDDAQSATIRDRSGYGNNGTILAATWERTGAGLWYLHFDGTDDYVTVADKAEFDTGAALTIKIWYRTATSQSSRALLIHDLSNYKYMFFLSSTSYLRFYVRQASGVTNSEYGEATNDNIWRQAIGTFDQALASDRVKIYINGTLEADKDGYDEVIASGDEGIILGQYGAAELTGDLALAEIYNRAWSASEALSSFNRERHHFGV